MLWQSGKRREAHRVAVEAVGLNPQHTPTLFGLAVMTYLLGDGVGAEEVFREAVRVTRWRHPELLRLWGQVSQLARTRRKHAASLTAIILREQACLELEMYDEARVVFERLHRVFPHEPLSMLGYAMTLLGQGEPNDVEQATQLLNSVVQLPVSGGLVPFRCSYRVLGV